MIETLPPTWTQYTDAGFAIPVALLVGGAIVTIMVVGNGVATVVVAIVVGVVVGVCVHPAVIMITARTRISKTVEVFIQLMFGFTGFIHQPEDYICAMVLSASAGTNRKILLFSGDGHRSNLWRTCTMEPEKGRCPGLKDSHEDACEVPRVFQSGK